MNLFSDNWGLDAFKAKEQDPNHGINEKLTMRCNWQQTFSIEV